MKKSIEETIRYVVDGPKFIDDQNLAYFDSWVKNKAQNKVVNLKQLIDNVFPPLEVGEVVTPWAAKIRALLTWWEPSAKGFSMANKVIP